MSRDCGKIVKEVIRVRQDDWTRPLRAIVISGVINPDRADRSMKRAFAAAGKEPDAAVAIANNSPEIVVSIGWASSRFLSGAARGDLRLGPTHWKIGRST